jgi:hypothetical protein
MKIILRNSGRMSKGWVMLPLIGWSGKASLLQYLKASQAS